MKRLGSFGKSVVWWKPVFAAFLLLPAMLVGTPVKAQYSRLGFGQYQHTRWTADDGAPTGISVVAQTPDGWLWLAANEGLFRFDGVTFERIPLPAGSPMERYAASNLLVTRSGELLVTFNQGGLAVYRKGRLQPLPVPSNSLPRAYMIQRPDGAIWAVQGGYAKDRLFQLGKDRWEEIDTGLGLPPGQVTGPCVTGDGSLWVTLTTADASGQDKLAVLPPGSKRFQISNYHVSPRAGCATDRQGRLWILDLEGARLAIGADGKPVEKAVSYPEAAVVDYGGVAFDAAGGLWSSTAASGIFYIPDAAKRVRTIDEGVRRYTEKDGLTSDSTQIPFIDRDNNIWFGNDVGLDRFRLASAVQEPGAKGQPGEGFAIDRSKAGIFVVAAKGMFQLSPGQPRQLLSESLIGLCSAFDKGIWGFHPTQAVLYQGTRPETISVSKGVEPYGTCAEDRQHRFWIATLTMTLMWHDGAGWHSPSSPFPQMRYPDLVVTPAGDVAYMSKNDEFVQLVDGKAVVADLTKYKLGDITWIAAGNRDMFVSGSNGLLRVRGNRVSRLDWRRFPWMMRLRGLVQTSRGETWMLRPQGIYRMSTAELDHAFDNPRSPIDETLYDISDGMRIAQSNSLRGAQMTVGADGRIWVLNKFGAAFLDPAKLSSNKLPPPVAIRSLTANDTVFRDPTKLVLPPGTHALDIAYTGLSLDVPRRMKFRYRLEGVDDDWVDPGTRRLASYSNLGPGKYRFEVKAANSAGVWSNKNATLEFEIRPTFFQSWPFYLLCALLVLGLLWLAYSMRLRAVAGRIRARMNERLDERERIARELHDTLLQSVQGLIMRFSNIAQDISAIPPAHREMLDALDSADAVVIEGRDRVHELRRWSDSRSLPEVVAGTAQRLLPPGKIETRVVVEGSQRDVYPAIADELLRIADEALFNVSKHAQAGKVRILIVYGAQALIVRIVDDGVGIPPEIAASGKLSGHFGLVGMHERANRIGAHLAIVSPSSGGTQIELRVSAHLAYADRPRHVWFAFWHRPATENRRGEPHSPGLFG